MTMVLTTDDLIAMPNTQIQALSTEQLSVLNILSDLPPLPLSSTVTEIQINSPYNQLMAVENIPSFTLSKLIWNKDNDELVLLKKDYMSNFALLMAAPAIIVHNVISDTKMLYVPVEEDDLKFGMSNGLYFKATKKTNRANYLRIET